MKRALPYLTVAAIVGVGSAVGCGGATTTFTRTGPTLPSQPDSCDFSVVTASPGESTTELGKIDIKYMKQTDWIYDESAFRRKVRTHVCQSGGDTVVAHINDNGLYVDARVFTSKATQVAPPSPEPASPEPEPEPTAEAAAPSPPPPPASTTTPAKSSPATATPAKKGAAAKDGDPAKAVTAKKPGKKGASGKKEADIRGKDGKVDIDKLL